MFHQQKILLYEDSIVLTLCVIIKVNSKFQLLVLLTKFEATFFIFDLILFSL